MRNLRKSTFVLLAIFALSLAALNYVVAVSGDRSPDYAAAGENFTVMEFKVNSTNSTPQHFLRAQFNYTGDNKSDVNNLTLYNDTFSLFGYNDAPESWQSSGSGLLLNITNVSSSVANITGLENFTLELNVSSGADRGNNISLDLVKVIGDNVTTNTSELPKSSTIIDSNPPRLDILSPEKGGFYSDSINITATTNDVVSGVNVSKWMLRNKTHNSTGWCNKSTDNFTFIYNASPLVDGNYSVEFRVNDTAGNSRPPEIRNLTVDTTTPNSTFVRPGSYSGAETTTVEVNLTDNYHINDSSVQFWFNGSEENESDYTTDGNEEIIIQLTYDTPTLTENKSYTANVSVADKAGNQLNSETNYFSFLTDFTAPSISNFSIEQKIVDPGDYEVCADDYVVLNWTASDNLSYIDHYEIWQQNRTYNENQCGCWSPVNTSAANTSRYNVTGLADDHFYRFKVEAVDAAGNRDNSSTVNATIDFKGPKLVEESIGRDKWANKSYQMIDFEITDISLVENDSIKVWDHSEHLTRGTHYNVTPDEANASAYRIYNYNYTGLGTNGDNYRIEVEANDTLNQTSHLQFNITYDSKKPSVVSEPTNESSPYDRGWFKDSANYSFGCSDENTSIWGYKLGDGNWTEDNSTYRTFNVSHDGNQSVTFYCRDQAFNTRSHEEYIAIDRDFTITDIDPDDGDELSTNETEVKVEFDDEDTQSGIDNDSFDFTFDGSDLDQDDLTWNDEPGDYHEVVYDADLDWDSQYTVNVTLEDNVGHSASRDWSFTTGSEPENDNGGNNNLNMEHSLDVDIDATIEIEQGAEKSLEVDVENDGDYAETGVDFTFEFANLEGITTGLEQDSADIDNGEWKKFNATIMVAEDQDTGDYTGKFTAESSDTSDSEEMTLTVVELQVETQPKIPLVLSGPNEVSVERGNSTSFAVKIENNHTQNLPEINLSADTELNVTLEYDEIDLDVDEVQNVSVDVNGVNVSAGVYELLFEAAIVNFTADKSINVKVQPEEEGREEVNQTLQEQKAKLNELESQLQKAKKSDERQEINESITRIKGIISDIADYVNQSDYASAMDLQREVEVGLNDTETRMQDLKSGGGNLWLWLLILGLLGVAAVVLYLSMVPEGDLGGYEYKFTPQAALVSVLGAIGSLKRKLKSLLGGKEKQKRESSEEKRKKKKIKPDRFY